MALVKSVAASLKNTWGFSPQSIPGLALWLDAADSSTVTGTSPVTAWNDKSGNGKNATATGTTITTSTLNGLPAINYSGASWLTAPVTSGVADPFTIFAVFNATYPINGPLYTTNTTTDGNGFFFDLAATSDSTTNLNDYLPLGGSFQTNANSTFRGNTTYVVSIVSTSVNGGSITLFRNGTSYMSGTTTGNFTWTSFLIGKRNIPSVPYTDQFAGKFGEFIIFNSALSTSQRQQVEGYLAAKWGLKANLSGSHPYFAANSIPFNRPFYPTDIPGLQLWMDAADTSTVTGTSSVTAWTNKGFAGGSASTTSGTINSTTTTINGLPTVSFGTNAYMTAPSMTFTQTTRTVFLVVKIGAAGVRRNFLLKTPAGSGTIDTLAFSYFETGTSITDLQLSFNGSNLYRATPLSPTIFSTTSIICMTTLSTNAGIFVNGNKQTLNVNNQLAYGTGTTTSQTIGGIQGDSSNPFDLGEAMIFDGNITDIQRQQVEQYLTWKWGIPTANLPTGHPGKLLPAFGTVSAPASVSYLVVGGGGGGGTRTAGGGGAGGLLTGSINVVSSTAYTVTVGAGGTGAPAYTATYGTNTPGTNGGYSLFAGITGYGGGGGGGGDQGSGSAGGCGGGSSTRWPSPESPGTPGGAGGAGTAGQGYAGATYVSGGGIYGLYTGGGGGGAGGTGTNNAGGIGYLSSISGTATWYAGGGGGLGIPGGTGGGGYGQGWSSNPLAGAGTTGLGGGGGGSPYGAPSPAGGNGGSGTVIIAYPSTYNDISSISGLTYTKSTTAGKNTIYIFTAGSGTISW